MRKITVSAAVLAGMCAAVLPTGAFAHHDPSGHSPSHAGPKASEPDGTTTSTTTNTNTNTNTSTSDSSSSSSSTSTTTAMPRTAGTVASYAGGVLTITLNDGTTLAGTVVRRTHVQFRGPRPHLHSRRLRDTFTVGEPVVKAVLSAVPAGEVWTDLVVVPSPTTTTTTTTTTSSSSSATTTASTS